MMIRVVLIGVLCLGSSLAYRRDWNKEDKTCNENAMFKRCADPCPKTCSGDILRDSEVADCDQKNCKPGCDCKKGYVLNDAGECISLDDCKASCKLHSHYNTESCSKTCKHMFTNEPCESVKENCECDEGYFLNSAGNCVVNFECQEEEVMCPVNQTFYTCGAACPLTCENMFMEETCKEQCTIGCDCYPGHVFNKAGVCIKADECFPEEIKCPINKVYKPCGNANSRTCENMYAPLECHEDCVPGCYCPDGLVFCAEQNLCIEPHDCLNSLENRACRNLDTNMHYYNCHIGEERTCQSPEILTEGDCCSGCYCKEGMVLNKNNKCILLDDCKWNKGSKNGGFY